MKAFSAATHNDADLLRRLLNEDPPAEGGAVPLVAVTGEASSAAAHQSPPGEADRPASLPRCLRRLLLNLRRPPPPHSTPCRKGAPSSTSPR